MTRLTWAVSAAAGLLAATALLAGPGVPTRVLAPGEKPHDSRLGKPRDLNGYFPFTPPTSKAAWEQRRREVRDQTLVATGLWPMPDKLPLQPVVHGAIDRGEYTVEKVFFASYPGHYVSGNLYRPKGRAGMLPAVLSPHGHWANGRFYQAGDQEVRSQMEQGAEQTANGARFPLQARCAQLARMGCVVFHYDMVGVADSQAIAHRAGFTDAEAELRLQSFMGLQTYNSIRALDFLLSLPEVDPARVGVTGASGGGTQTFMLCAIDDRPAVAFPAVMVSTAMQGGCVCENCSYLRQGTGNVELAGLFAPRALGMSAANDWTREIETKGLPELKALYRLYGAEDRVMAKCLPQFGHNYNQVSRELMYTWFNRHLRLGQREPVRERPFEPVPPKDLSVYDARHPRPADTVGAAELRRVMTAASDRQLAALRPKDPESLREFRRVVGTALGVMIHDLLPEPGEVEVRQVGERNACEQKLLLGRRGAGEQIPALLLAPPGGFDSVVVWVHLDGKAGVVPGGVPDPAARLLLDGRVAILAPDVFLTGEFGDAKAQAVNAEYAGYTFGYNRPVLANRVHDLLTAVAYARGLPGVRRVDLVGSGKAGPWVLLARALCGDAVARTVANVDGFRFDSVRTTADEMMLPGALKYGGLPAFTALCCPGELYLHNVRDSGVAPFATDAYRAGGVSDRLHVLADAVTPEQLAGWLRR
jgi:dienelactone hydrolase